MSSVVASVSADDYLRDVLAREAVDSSPSSPYLTLHKDITGYAARIAPEAVLNVIPVGGFAHGTATMTGRPIGFLYAFSPKLPDSIASLYARTLALFERLGYEPEPADAAIALNYRNVPIDIVPAKRESMTGEVHELWVSRTKRSVKTSPTAHAGHIHASGRTEEIRSLKIWRDQMGLDFPSFYLELSVLAALRKRPAGTLAENVWAVWGYLSTLFPARVVLDPFNANNIVSDHMSPLDKDAIRKAAQFARNSRAWSEIIR